MNLAAAMPAASQRVLQLGMWWGGPRAGGLDRVFANLVHQLPSCGIAVSALVEGPDDVGAATRGVVQAFAPSEAGLLTRLIGVRAAVRRELKRESPKLVAAHFALYAWPVLDLIRPRPFVMHFHGPWSAEALEESGNRLVATAKHRLEARIYQRADRLIVLSEAFKQILCREYGVAAERIRIVPGPVDVERFGTSLARADARRSFQLSAHRPVVVAVRRLARRMGLDRLITAMVDVRAAVSDVLLLVAGSGEMRSELERQVQRLGLTDTVRFLGFVPEEALPSLYRAANVHVVPSIALEGFGLVAAEALCAGTPSLVTPVGGLPDVVRDLDSSLVLASSEPEAISSGLIAALTGRNLPSPEECRDYAVRRFSARAVAEQTAAVYRELL